VKVSSTMARPGNKRIASQTLGPDLQKAQKGGFSFWDDVEDGTSNGGDDEGVLARGYTAGTGMDGGEVLFTLPPGMTLPTSPPAGGMYSAGGSHLAQPTAPQYQNNVPLAYFPTWPPVGSDSGHTPQRGEMRRGA